MHSKSSNSIPLVNISVEQSKLLSSAKRIQIISCLQNSAKTAKQVAVELQQSPGSTHYHIKKLHEGGLVDLVDTRTEGGSLRNTIWLNRNGLTRMATNSLIHYWQKIQTQTYLLERC